MILLVDTDILIDVALDRMPYAESSSALLDRLEQTPGTAFVAWHTLSNFYYLVAPTRGPDDTKSFLEELTKFVSVAPTTTTSFRYAVQLVMKDFEDAMQVAAAMACDAEVIATRNLRDYVNAPIKPCTPSSLLQELD